MGVIARAIKAASGTINFLAGSAAKSSEVNSDFNTVYGLVNGNIDNDNISGTAAIASSKLAAITDAGKVSGVSFTNLAGIPSGAGVIPSANLPDESVDLTTEVTGVLPIANGGTSATTAALAINALLPSQTSNSGKFLTTNGSASSWGSVAVGLQAGNYTFAHGSPYASNSTTYTERSFAYVGSSGTVRVRFGIANVGGIAYGRIYVNGGAVGTERSTASHSLEYFTEDITVTAGDEVQLYVKSNHSGYIAVNTGIELQASNANINYNVGSTLSRIYYIDFDLKTVFNSVTPRPFLDADIFISSNSGYIYRTQGGNFTRAGFSNY